MTETLAPARNGVRMALLFVLLASAMLRLWHIDFGLPALNDADEPLFIMKALDMLRDGTLNPGWFGHPATLLFYALAMLFAAIATVGLAVGAWPSTDAFAAAVFANPEIIVLPARVMIATCGVLCVYLTYLIGKRAAGAGVGLAAATLLAVNPLHVELSQIIRTDVPATALMLASTYFALRFAEIGRTRDILIAGSMAGLACAMKWPAALVLFNIECAVLSRVIRRETKPAALLLPPLAAATMLLAVSPYLILDHATVVRNLAGEGRPVHLGATGGTILENLGWYARHVFTGTLGVVGSLLALAGGIASVLRFRILAAAVFPAAAVFLIAISAQSLVWERWAVPLLPFIALAAALGIRSLAANRMQVVSAATAALALITLPATLERTRIHANDTRQVASTWLRANTSPRASILVEHAGFDLFERMGPILFPMGDLGCIDIRKALQEQPRYADAEKTRTGAIVDIGNVDPGSLSSCRADYTLFTNYDRYRAESERFSSQLNNYRRVSSGIKLRTIIRPIPGERGGPVVYIFEGAA